MNPVRYTVERTKLRRPKGRIDTNYPAYLFDFLASHPSTKGDLIERSATYLTGTTRHTIVATFVMRKALDADTMHELFTRFPLLERYYITPYP
ncbi:MAG: hypothetical protein WC796_00980 [Candidatus Pacearchaeota archaeon]|jgi:hypothetical protein